MTSILGIDVGGTNVKIRVSDGDEIHAALEPDYVVLGGGNAQKLAEIPPYARLGDNDCAFAGAFRLWEPFESSGSLTGPDPVESNEQ